MSAEPDPLAAVRGDAAGLDALASGSPVGGDPALDLLAGLRAHIDLVVGQVAPGAVAHDAELLDLLATGLFSATADPSSDPATALLADLRAAVDRRTVRPGLPATIPDELAPRRRAALPRHAARVAVVAAGIGFAVIGTTGVAAAAYGSHPGGTWYSLRTATFGRTDDDPVVDQQLVARIHQEVAAAQASPASAPSHLAEASAAYARLQKIAPLVHDPVAARRIEATANAVHVSLSHSRLLLPAPRTVPRPGPSPTATRLRPASGMLAGGRQVVGAVPRPAPVIEPTPSVQSSPTHPADPFGTPSTVTPSVGQVSPTDAGTASTAGPATGPTSSGPTSSGPASSGPTSSGPIPSGPTLSGPTSSPSSSESPSLSPSGSSAPTSPAASPSPSVSGSGTASPAVPTSAPTARSAPVKVKKPLRRKKTVTTTATLMSATVPATNASLRPSR